MGWIRVSMLIDPIKDLSIKELNVAMAPILFKHFGVKSFRDYIISLGKESKLANYDPRSLQTLYKKHENILNTILSNSNIEMSGGKDFNQTNYANIGFILKFLSCLLQKTSLKMLIDQILVPLKAKIQLNPGQKNLVLQKLPEIIDGLANATENMEKDESIKQTAKNLFREVLAKFASSELVQFFGHVQNHDENCLSYWLLTVRLLNYFLQYPKSKQPYFF